MNAIERVSAAKVVPVVFAKAVEPIGPAVRIVQRCRAIPAMPRDLGHAALAFTAGNLPRAIALDRAMPSYETIRAAHARLSDALDQPLDPAMAQAMVAVMLGALGKRPNDDPELYVWGLGEAVSDDDVANVIYDDDGGFAFAPVTLALAIRKVMREQVFMPAPAELRAACSHAASKLFDLARALAHAGEVREVVEDILQCYQPGQHQPASIDEDVCPF